jgi:uncharacterized protein (TIGR02996 family)
LVSEFGDRNLGLESAAFADFGDHDAWRVYADWLLSQGDERGEIANLALHFDGAFLSERQLLAERMRELERPHIDAWHSWAQDHDLLEVQVSFKRGFAHALVGPLPQLRAAIDEVFEREPIQRLTLTDVEPDELVRLCDRSPSWLGRLQYLKLVGEVGELGAAALASVALPRLRRLNLLGTGIDTPACTHLARLQSEVLEHLTLTANAIDDDGLIALLASPHRGRWRELYLSQNHLHARALGRLANDRELSSLTGLYLRNIEAGPGDFEVFANPTALPALRTLELSGWNVWQHRDLCGRLRERLGDGLRLR